MELIDSYGRKIRKLRLSLLDACNFRCLYCMPLNPKFMPTSELLSKDEILRLSSILTDFGVEQIRVTGGEPTLRPEFLDIIERLSELKISKLSFTTNGLYVEKYLKSLIKTKCHFINFSLDSLNEKTFHEMTKSKDFKKVLSSILMAREMGFDVKVNAVVMKGLNDSEVFDFVEFAAKEKIEVRFLELMKIGIAREEHEKYFVSATDLIRKIKNKYLLKRMTQERDSTSFNYLTNDGANIGFIASESMPFCSGCSRLRLTASGQIRPCLMKNSGISIKNLSKEQLE